MANLADFTSCQYSFWSSLFAETKCRMLMKSKILCLPSQFIDYLNTDGIVIPESVRVSSIGDDQLSDDEDALDNYDEGEKAPVFSDLDKCVKNAIHELGGKVFIKFNWSAPTDATWINCESMMCTNVGDVYLLLKSSDKVSRDLELLQLLQKELPVIFPSFSNSLLVPTLVLKKWGTLHPSMGFRCFVHWKQLIGISQRDCSFAYEFLKDAKESLEESILLFFQSEVKFIFPLESYTFDIYIDKKKRIWILDFNVFGEPTNPLLFEWSELVDISASLYANNAIDGVGNKDSHLSSCNHHVTNSLQHSHISLQQITENKFSTSTNFIDNNNINKCNNQINLEITHRIELQFRIVENLSQTLAGDIGASRGPIDIVDPAFQDFSKFMRLRRNESSSDEDGEEEDTST